MPPSSGFKQRLAGRECRERMYRKRKYRKRMYRKRMYRKRTYRKRECRAATLRSAALAALVETDVVDLHGERALREVERHAPGQIGFGDGEGVLKAPIGGR